MGEFNQHSTDAMHWVEHLVEIAEKNNFSREEILDTSWLVGWFANYWAAVHDPLQAQVESMREALERVMVLISNEACGGVLKNMSTLEGRSVWFDLAKLERENIQQALKEVE